LIFIVAQVSWASSSKGIRMIQFIEMKDIVFSQKCWPKTVQILPMEIQCIIQTQKRMELHEGELLTLAIKH